MDLNSQVTSLPLAKRLKELGVRQNAYFTWAELKRGDLVLWDPDTVHINQDSGLQDHPICSAFTVAELGEILPKWTSSWRDVAKGDGDLGMGDSYICQIGRNLAEPGSKDDWFEAASTEADARAKMLIYIIEKGIVKP